MESLVELQHVTVRFGDFPVLRDICLSFPAGLATFVLGPSGGGKSTLIKVAAGLTPPNEGDVLVGGKAWGRMGAREVAEFRRYAAFAFQDAALWANMSVWQNLALPLQYHYPKMPADKVDQRISSALERVGFTELTDVRPSDLSAGEQKMIGFARALVMDPMMLFLDSPLSGLDHLGSGRLMKICRDYRKSHRTLIVVDDNLDFCFRIADFVYIINHGRVRVAGKLAEVIGTWPDFMEELGPAQFKILEDRGLKDGGRTL